MGHAAAVLLYKGPPILAAIHGNRAGERLDETSMNSWCETLLPVKGSESCSYSSTAALSGRRRFAHKRKPSPAVTSLAAERLPSCVGFFCPWLWLTGHFVKVDYARI